MDDPKPKHIYDVPVDVLPDIFQYLELKDVLAYSSASRSANEQVQLGQHRKYKMHIDCTSRVVSVTLREKPEDESEEDQWPFENKNCKMITIRILQQYDGSTESENFLIMDGYVIPVWYSEMNLVYTMWEKKHKGIETILSHLKSTFNVRSVCARFRLIENEEIFPILDIILARGLTVDDFSRSLSNRDPDTATKVNELREIPANTVTVTSDTRFFELSQLVDLHLARHYYAKCSKPSVYSIFGMKWCWYIILEKSSWSNADFNEIVKCWMGCIEYKCHAYQLRLFCLSNPKDIDVSLIVDGLDAASVDPGTAANIDKSILPGQCFRYRRSDDGAVFLIYQSETEFIVKRELPVALLCSNFSMLFL